MTSVRLLVAPVLVLELLTLRVSVLLLLLLVLLLPVVAPLLLVLVVALAFDARRSSCCCSAASTSHNVLVSVLVPAPGCFLNPRSFAALVASDFPVLLADVLPAALPRVPRL